MSLFTTPHKPGILPLGITPITRQGEKTFVSGSRIVFHRFRGDCTHVNVLEEGKKKEERKYDEAETDEKSGQGSQLALRRGAVFI